LGASETHRRGWAHSHTRGCDGCHPLNTGTYGTTGVGLGQAIAAAVAEPDRPVFHLSGDSAIGFSGTEMETLIRYNFPVKIVVLNNGGIGPGMPEIPDTRCST
jgi:2-hydroxyacyl-CoA lyase 1